MRFAVIDGQGGGIGRSIIGKLRQELPEADEILALGTNSLATSAMLRAGANDGATGENALLVNVDQVDFILGPLSIILPNSMLGELTPKMAKRIVASKARKILLPIHRNNLDIVGLVNEPLPHLVDVLVQQVKMWRSQKLSGGVR